MHKVKVKESHYQQGKPYVGQVGEVIGHWGPDSNEEGRDGFMVQFPNGEVVALAEDEVEEVLEEG